MGNLQGALVGAVSKGKLDPDEIDHLIERRASEPTDKEKVNREEESWRESVRAYNAEHREARRHLWIAYYRKLARNHAGIAEHFERRAAALCEREAG